MLFHRGVKVNTEQRSQDKLLVHSVNSTQRSPWHCLQFIINDGKGSEHHWHHLDVLIYTTLCQTAITISSVWKMFAKICNFNPTCKITLHKSSIQILYAYESHKNFFVKKRILYYANTVKHLSQNTRVLLLE